MVLVEFKNVFPFINLTCYSVYPKLSILSSLENTPEMSYFLPEAEKMTVELEAREKQKGSAEYQKFVSDQQTIATIMMNVSRS